MGCSIDIFSNAAGGFIVEVGKFVCRYIYPKIKNIVRFSSEIENLRKEMEKLTKFRVDINGEVEKAKGDGYKPKPDVVKWLEDVEKLKNDWETMQESIEAAKRLAYKCCPQCSLRSEVSTQAWNIRDEICRLIDVKENFGSNLVDKRIEVILGPSIEGQSAARKNLHKLLQLLENDEVCKIGVWGTGGIGKTTLVKYLNRELLKTDVSNSELYFGVVVWVKVPELTTEVKEVQKQIAISLNLNVDDKGSVESIASKISKRLKQEMSFLLILDDVWEVINLDHVGVPQLEAPKRSKVIITSRSLDVCRQMNIDTQMKIYTLDEDESWQLFIKSANLKHIRPDAANLEPILAFAKEIAKECDGLPLAITVIGAFMRGKERVELWKDVLESLRMYEPHNQDVKNKIYKVIKRSFDSLESQDIELSSEQRSKHVNKKRGDIQSCFLYCSLYTQDISTDDLINCWWAEGFLGEHDTYEQAYNRGITMIESLKDACLLEDFPMDSVKMHEVVRAVAIWIANSFRDEHNSLIKAGINLTTISHIIISASVKRISFIRNRIKCLPDCFTECPKTTSLLLQGNHPLEKIPHELFLAFPALRVLNLSETGIRALPSSINSLYQLHALILQNCYQLTELPPIGDLLNLQLLDCDNTMLHHLPQGMDKLTNLRLLNLPAVDLKESIGQEFFLKLSSIEMLNMMESENFLGKTRETLLGPTAFDEILSLQKLTSLFIKLDSSSNFNRDHTWMTRLKRFCIGVGRTSIYVPFNKSTRMISVSNCEFFSNGELSGMLQFASDLHLENCKGVRKLIACNSFNGLKSLHIRECSCDFKPAVEEGSDPLPYLEHLCLELICNLNSVSDFSQLLGLRFCKLRQLDISKCQSLTCLFDVGGDRSAPKHLKDITIADCDQLVELFVQSGGSSQPILVDSEIPRVRKLWLTNLPKLGTLGEPQGMWEHLEVLELIFCDRIRKLPHSIQTSNNIKVIRGRPEWWSQLEWDDDNFKSNLEHCFLPTSSQI